MEMYDRTKILSLIYNVFKSITKDIVFDDRPTSSTTQMTYFLVVELGDVDPLHAYGDTYVTIKIFYRDNDGKSQVSKISEIEQKIYKLLPIDNDMFKALSPKSLKMKSDGSGFHYLPIYFELILK